MHLILQPLPSELRHITKCQPPLNQSSGRADPIPWVQPGTVKASILRFIPNTRRKWNYAFSISSENARPCVSPCLNRQTWSGTAICQKYAPDSCTDIVLTARMLQNVVNDLILINFCWTH